MRLDDALIESDVKVINDIDSGNRIIKGLTCDSRKVRPGYLFAAFLGSQKNGSSFVPEAISNGAIAILTENNLAQNLGFVDVPIMVATNPRRTYALVSSRFYQPSPITVAAITGTNGKTSTACFLRQIWAGLGFRAGSVGTLGFEVSGFDIRDEQLSISQTSLTTPDSAELHLALQKLSNCKVKHVAIEASSHGLGQHRLDGVNISAAAFTNLTRDHLDYHGTFKNYIAAKKRLFTDLLIAERVSVINSDDPFSKELISVSRSRRHQIVTYGLTGKEVKLLRLITRGKAQNLLLEVCGERYESEVPLVGKFQISNVLCAVSLAIGLGSDPANTIRQLEKLKEIPGRIQWVGDTALGVPIYVDYAHSPDSLSELLTALRPYTKNKLHLVFGCGGDRDSGKRAQMGEIARRLADSIVITDDNPRFEDPGAIRHQIKSVCPGGKEIGCREEAIRFAITNVSKGDLLVIAGKGHESYQVVGKKTLTFSDGDVVKKILIESGL